MLKFPLKKEIILVTDTIKLKCKIDFAGSDTLVCRDVYELIFNSDNTYELTYLSDKFIIDRIKTLGYSNIVDSVIDNDENKKIKNIKKIPKKNKQKPSAKIINLWENASNDEQ